MRKHVRPLALVALVLGALSFTAPAQAHSGHGTPTRPLLLVGGLIGPVSYMDNAKAYFQGQGFTVYSMQLSGNPPGTVDIRVSAQAVCDKVNSIRSQTGAAKIDVVGHSEGGLAARYCIRYQGGIDKIAILVSLGSPDYGSNAAWLCWYYPGCLGMTPGSQFLNELNSGDDTPGSVRYVKIFSYEANGGFNGEDKPLQDGATNVAVQDRCPGRYVSHIGEYDDGAMRDLIRDAVIQSALTTTCP